MKKILHVTGMLNMGGAEKMVMNIYRHIDRENYIFDFLVCGKEIGYFEKEVHYLGGTIHHISKWTESIYKHLVEIYKVVKKNNYQILHFHTQNAFLTSLEILSAKLAGAKTIIVHSHNTADWRNLFLVFLHKCCKRILVRLTDKKLSCGIDAAKYLFGTDASVTIVPLPVDTVAHMYDEKKYDRIRMQEGDNDKKVYIHVGRFSDVKNHDFLIDVFSEIVVESPNSVLWLLGDGMLRQSIEKKVKEKGLVNLVKFFGNIDDVGDKLVAADMFIFPSKYEGFPTTVLEAQAAGLPCVISDTITKDIKLTDLVTQLSLEEKPRKWAEYIIYDIANKYFERKKYNKIIDEKYGIRVVVELMESIYG